MMPGSKYQPTDPDIIKIIQALEHRIAKLERTPQTAYAGVDSAGVVVKNGVVLHNMDDDFRNGYHSVGSNVFVNTTLAIQTTLGRADEVVSAYTFGDGTPITGETAYKIVTVEGALDDPDFKNPTIFFYDKSGDSLITDSTNARRGFGDPVLPVPWNDKVLTPTTSGTAADIAQFEWYSYHAHCLIRLVSSNDAATTGTVQAQEESTGNILATITTPANTTQYNDLVIKRSSMVTGDQPNGTSNIINIQHLRASGAGTVRTRVANIVGIDLSLFQDF